MRKKCFLAFAILCCASMNAQESYWMTEGETFWLDPFIYQITSETEVSCIGKLSPMLAHAYALPPYVEMDGKEYTVTSIAPYAFTGPMAAEGGAICIFSIPNTVVSIGKGAFSGCNRLDRVNIPEGIKRIEAGTFAGCAFSEIELPEGLTYIGENAFRNCHYLKHISIPEQIDTICSCSFAWCENLESVDMGSSVKVLENGAFYGSGLKSFTFSENLISIGKGVLGDCRYIESLTISNNLVDFTGSYYNYDDPWAEEEEETPVLSESERFEGGTFYCENLRVINIGKGFTRDILDGLFDKSGPNTRYHKLEQISVEAGHPIYSSVDGILYDQKKQKLLFCPGKKSTSFTIPDSVTEIAEYAFFDTQLKSMIIPDGVKKIGDFAFRLSWHLQSISFPNSLEHIGKMAFEGTNIPSITLPEGMISIGDGAFYNNESLTSVELPNSLVYIGDYAFGECPALKTVINHSWVPQSICPIVITEEEEGVYGTYIGLSFWTFGTLHVPQGRKEVYEAEEGWKNFTVFDDLPVHTNIIEDAQVYENEMTYEYDKIVYNRTFFANVWNAWFVPFAVPTSTLEDHGLTAAYIEGIHNYDDDQDGEIDRSVMEVVKIANGTLRAGTPYLIKAAEDYTYPLVIDSPASLQLDSDVHPIHTETATTIYDFVGTYRGVDAATTTAAGNYYSLGSKNNMEHRLGKILPLRWYMTTSSKDPLYDRDVASAPKQFSIRVVGEEDETSGIRTVYSEKETIGEPTVLIFDMNGISRSELQKGINIINGNKVLLR